MLRPSVAYSGFSVGSLEDAKEFYGGVLGLAIEELPGRIRLQLPGGAKAIAYLKPHHVPAAYTMLNFEVDDIDSAVQELKTQGVTFEKYDGMFQNSERISRGRGNNKGPNIAWFKDPAGNILAVVQNK